MRNVSWNGTRKIVKLAYLTADLPFCSATEITLSLNAAVSDLRDIELVLAMFAKSRKSVYRNPIKKSFFC